MIINYITPPRFSSAVIKFNQILIKVRAEKKSAILNTIIIKKSRHAVSHIGIEIFGKSSGENAAEGAEHQSEERFLLNVGGGDNIRGGNFLAVNHHANFANALAVRDWRRQ